MKRESLAYPVRLIILFGLYVTTAYWGLQVHAVSHFASLIWIPSGLSLAFLLIFGIRFWPAIALGALTANYLNGAPVLAAMGIGLGNALEAITAAYLLKRVVKLDFALERVNDVLSLVFFGALLSTLISASVGTTSLWLSNTISSSDYGSTFISWWAGDGISNLILCPLLLVWSRRPAVNLSRRTIAEFGLFSTALVLVTESVFGDIGARISGYRLRSYLMFPVFMWSALRLGQRMTVTALMIFSILATYQTLKGLGPYNTGSVEANLLNLQLFVAVLATSAMVLAAAVSERTKHERQKDEFISIASHELKTPLTSIKTLTQTLQLLFEKKGDRQSASYMKHMNRQLDRLNRLVFKMLDLTKIQEGRITLQKERFAIGPLIREIAQEVVETTHHEIVIKGDVKARIVADRDRIGRVLTNLLTNAAKYSPKADKIIVGVVKKEEELTISVRDYGIGISKQDQQHIFERFFQSSTTRASQKKASLGLGLFIAKEIVERHGGKIWVSSSKSNRRRGSTFCFTLPLRPAEP